MGKLIAITVRLVRAGKQAYGRKWSFLALFLCAFLGSVGVLGKLDLLPEPAAVAQATPLVEGVNAAPPAAVREEPEKIEIPAIGLSASIANPTSTSIQLLDQELLRGAVRYPSSAKLNETGNVVLFGHSSYLPIVRNPAYKTFNGIQKLKAGDAVIVYSSGTAYSYRVRSMTKESAENAGIPLDVSGRVLTLSTCDSFGAKTDRFVVVADFVESHSISS
jgi:LPXTG-site transpeptidase (sortase) family protein